MKEGGGVTNACICVGTHSVSYRTDWWMMTKHGRDEVIMALQMGLGFLARSAQRWIQGGAKIGQWGAPSPKDFFFRSECNSNKPNASSYHELKHRDCLLFGLISQIWPSCFLINHLLRNLTFNRSAHCTQESDQCPLGLLLWPLRLGWLLVCCLYKEVYLQIFKRVSFDYTAVAGSGKVWPVNKVNHTSLVAVVTPTDRPKSVRNRYLIELFCGVVCVVTLPFWHFRWCRGFCHRTESDLLLFVFS